MHPLLQKCRYIIEAAPAFTLYHLLRLLPYKIASATGGLVASWIGRVLPVHKIALHNLAAVFPEKTSKERHEIACQVWHNLGCVAAEHPHISNLKPDVDILIEGGAALQEFREKKQPVIYISAHLGNWELLGSMAHHLQMPFTGIYRRANNPFIDTLIQQSRYDSPSDYVAKSSTGNKKLLHKIKNGENIAFLLDQKFNAGVEVPFFGMPAMMATAPVEIARRYKAPIIMARCIRLPQHRFKIILEKPRFVTESDTTETVLQEINSTFEKWIREHPEQWLWLHRRWKNLYKTHG